ncbi:MAG: hypothetical protein K0S70_217 [Microbacterium sp.]|nr:hypothetical protein [Microbacterium sp.]
MPNVSPENVRTPAGSDAYALTTDLRLMGESIRSLVPVASTSARDAVVAAMVTAGRPVTTANPIIVVRADAPAGAEVEISTDGTNWRTLGSDSGANVTSFGTGWSSTGSGHVPRVRRDGNQVFLYGAVTLAAGGAFTNILTVPADYRPPTASTRFIGVSPLDPAGGTPGIRVLTMGTGGVVSSPSSYGIPGSMNVGGVLPLIASWWMD